jgi:hypothetical protein
LKEEGLLERGYDWYVQRVKCEPTALHSLEFNGVLFSWKEKLGQAASKTRGSRSLTIFVRIFVRSTRPTEPIMKKQMNNKVFVRGS